MGSEMCIRDRSSPDWEEPAEPAQDPRANATTTNDEWPKAKPPDPRFRWRSDPERKGLVVTTMRCAHQDAWTCVLEPIEPVPAHAKPKHPADRSHREAEETIRGARLRPRGPSEPGHPLAGGGRSQRISAIAAVRTYLPLIHLSNPTRRPVPAAGPAAPGVGYRSGAACSRRE